MVLFINNILKFRIYMFSSDQIQMLALLIDTALFAIKPAAVPTH